MLTLTNPQELAQWRLKQHGTVGLVPTMGALHVGHGSLVDAAVAHCDAVLVSVFVNPLQFGAGEDFDKYPRVLAEDSAFLASKGVAAVYAPSPADMYPQGFQTTVKAGAMAFVLCGAHRAGHFDGVLTVVLKLFQQSQATHAFFGEKDFQQVTLIRRMVADFNLPITIVSLPTVREANGLALSSRNRYLSLNERAISHLFNHELQSLCDTLRADFSVRERTLALVRDRLLTHGFAKVDYLELRDAATLEPAQTPVNARVFGAVWLGNTRLIDNIPL